MIGVGIFLTEYQQAQFSENGGLGFFIGTIVPYSRRNIMNLFSQRKGIKPIKSFMQIDSMDEELKNSLWNALSVYYWDRVRHNPGSIYSGIYLSDNRDIC